MIESAPRFYPFFVQELGWSRQQVTSGNAYSKIVAGLRDRTGSYTDGFLVLVGLAAIGSAAVTLLPARSVDSAAGRPEPGRGSEAAGTR